MFARRRGATLGREQGVQAGKNAMTLRLALVVLSFVVAAVLVVHYGPGVLVLPALLAAFVRLRRVSGGR